MGFDKIYSYDNGELYPYTYHNAYVGGDAYNYIINGNYAIGAGLKISDALATENANGDAAQTYANIVAVRSGEESSEKTKALVDALKTDKVKSFIDEKYAGAVLPIF